MLRQRASNIDVKKANRNRIYRFIYQHDGVSKPEIVQRLEMSLPTVMQNVKLLYERGLIRSNGSLESTGGRKAVAISCVKDARLAVGVDIHRNHVGAVVVDMEGSVLRGVRNRLPFAQNRSYAAKVGRIVRRLIADSGVDADRILGAGVALPGIVSADGGHLNTSVLDAVDYPTDILGQALGMPCAFMNGANAAGMAEMWNAGQERDFVFLFLGITVGGAILRDGRPHPGDNQRGGEFGHLTIVPDGARCHCGKKGCLNAYCNAMTLAECAGGELDVFFDRLRRGDAKARAAWEEYLDRLAVGINILRMAFDCDVVVGGLVGASMDGLLDDLRTRVGRLNSFGNDGRYVRLCRRRTEASAVGAALVHIERFMQAV